MAANRGKYRELVAPGLMGIFFNRLKLRATEYSKWINEKKSRRAYEEEFKMAGLGPFVRKPEGTVYTFDEPLAGDIVRYVHQTYGLGFRVTMEMIEDDLYGIMSRMASELGKSARVNKEVRAASVLNNAFSSSYPGLDGTSLINAAHPNLGTGTQSNLISPAADLDETSLKAAIELFENVTDDRGLFAEVRPWKLLIPTGYIWTAGVLLETAQKPGGANNDKNIIMSRYGLDYEVLHYLNDTDSWFLVARKDEHDMKMFIRKGDTFRDTTDELTEDDVYTAHHRLSVGHGDWRGVVGSPGA